MADKKFADAFKKKLQEESGASNEWMNKVEVMDFNFDDDEDETETEEN